DTGIDLECVLVDGDELILVAAELIANVTDELFQQHLERHDAGCAAVFVHNDSHLVAGALHLKEEGADEFRLGSKHGWPHGEVYWGVFGELALGKAAEDILDAKDCDYCGLGSIVKRVKVNG